MERRCELMRPSQGERGEVCQGGPTLPGHSHRACLPTCLPAHHPGHNYQYSSRPEMRHYHSARMCVCLCVCVWVRAARCGKEFLGHVICTEN